jgi:hypothetical protein
MVPALALALALAIIALIGVIPRVWPPGDSLHTVTLPSHTGVGVDTTDTFLGQPNFDVECFTFMSGNGGGTMLPIWPPGYKAKYTFNRPFLGLYRPEDPADNAYNVISEILEFHGEWVTVSYEELRPRLVSEVPEACRWHRQFLVADTIQRS